MKYIVRHALNISKVSKIHVGVNNIGTFESEMNEIFPIDIHHIIRNR